MQADLMYCAGSHVMNILDLIAGRPSLLTPILLLLGRYFYCCVKEKIACNVFKKNHIKNVNNNPKMCNKGNGLNYLFCFHG